MKKLTTEEFVANIAHPEVFESSLKKKGIDTSFLDIYRIKLPKCLAA